MARRPPSAVADCTALCKLLGLLGLGVLSTQLGGEADFRGIFYLQYLVWKDGPLYDGLLLCPVQY